jgi:anti-sigma B factor antagonist
VNTGTRIVDGIAIVDTHGRIRFGDDANGLRDTLKGLLATTKRIVLNLADVEHIDSGGLGTLVGFHSSARSEGAEIKLTGVNARLRETLQVTRLLGVFEVYDSEEEAIAALRKA